MSVLHHTHHHHDQGPAAEYFAGEEPRPLEPGASATDAATGRADATDAATTTEPDADEGTARPWAAGETYVFDESGETVTEPAATDVASGSSALDAPRAYWAEPDSPYPQEAPTTIDGTFVEDPEQPTEPGRPAAGRHRHGGTA